MKQIVKETINNYKAKREEVNYSVFDIEMILKDLAEKGMIWTLVNEEGLCEAEQVLINHYYEAYRHLQNYDGFKKEEKTSIEQKSTSHKPSITPQEKSSEAPKLVIQDIENFAAYQKADQLERIIYKITKKFPSFEQEHIADQVRRSASSIKKSIAQGEQQYVKEKFYRYSIAIGSAKETISWLEISLDLKYISIDKGNQLIKLTEEVLAILKSRLQNLKEEYKNYIDLPNPYVPDARNFKAYQIGKKLVKEVYHISYENLGNHQYLQRNLRKDATSVVANIAESNQLYIKKKQTFFNIAIQALRGLNASLDTVSNIDPKNAKKVDKLKEQIESIEKILLKTLSNISCSKK